MRCCPVARRRCCGPGSALSLAIAALLTGRVGRLRVSLSAALLLLLVLDPLALFAPGAQLSFVAAAALSRDVAKNSQRAAIVSLLRVSATATLSLANPFGIAGPDGPAPANDTLIFYLNFLMKEA